MKKSKIYTQTGDEGFTSFVGGKRVPKTHLRLEAYGTIDELNAFIGCLAEEISDRHDSEILLGIQSALFTVGGYLSTEEPGPEACGIHQEDVELLEREMDEMDAMLPPLRQFILPGGSKGGALAHVCRTVCRRAERSLYHVHESAAMDGTMLKYMNRLSDYFFLFARKTCFVEKGQEILWEKPCR